MTLVKSDMWNDKAFDKAVKALPALYSGEFVKAQDKIMAVHCFIGGSDWWFCEARVEEGLLYGFACLNGDWQNAEWGYSSIEELKGIKIPKSINRDIIAEVKRRNGKPDTIQVYQEIDFDLHWTPCIFIDIPKVAEELYGLPEKLSVHDKTEIQVIEPEVIAIDNEYDAAMSSYCS